ncbi:hypothetical protein L3Y34_018262 [Caenorhabditis briggsae]|uniref:Peptidase C1A papain C-terminal domain-containing protein n=2 Tax=Caenorhabditis briggsae TaxID=6238 RepID=A0AAE9DKU3_CAEBR|nr:hypothetical protein L3Y34_018262 [Caenorhabditis briggsae]
MRALLFLILLFFIQKIESQSCKNNEKYCDEVLAVSVIRYSSLEYKCQFPVFLAKRDILKLDPTVYLTMKIGDYCQRTCCSFIQSTTPSTAPSTTPSTTPSTIPTTTAFRTSLEKFNDAMNNDGAFKSLMDVINFNSSASEGLKRFRVYSDAKKEVDEHNIMYTLGMTSYKMITNEFSVALSGEIAPLTLNLDALTPTVIPATSPSPIRSKRQTTDSVDWRPYMKPILNQLTCGGCWAFSMIAMVEGFFSIRGYDPSSLSVQQLLNCDTAKDLTYGLANVGCKGGYFQIAGTYMERTGARNAEDIPFDMDDSSCDSPYFPPVVPTILLFDDGYISGNISSDQLITMEQNIEDKVRKGPIAVGMAAGPDIYKYSEGIYDGDCGTSINHAVVIVGFTADYWLIRNSWGSTWGEEGYFRVKRTPGKDPCRLYSYWSQATGVGVNETYVPPRAGGGEFVIPTTSPPVVPTMESSSAKNDENLDECRDGMCEEDCGCEYDDDEDEDDYEEDVEGDNEQVEEAEEETITSTTDSSSSSTTSESTTTSSTSSTTTPTTSSSTTTPTTTTSTTRKSITTVTRTPLKTTRTSPTTTRKTTTTTPRRTTTSRKTLFDRWSDGWNNFWG